jgi:hypothetical protein
VETALIPRHRSRYFFSLLVLTLSETWVGIGSPVVGLEAAEAQQNRPVRVADCIRMTRFADAVEGFSPNTAHFSPDGNQFVVLLKKGNLQNNTVEYSLVFWRTADVFHSPKPEVLLTFSSSSNRPAIRDVRWVGNDTIAFLGENPGEEQQLYTLSLATRSLSKLTAHPTSLAAYSMSADGETIVFGAKQPVIQLFNDRVRREGIRVTTQILSDLIAGDGGSGALSDYELFLKKRSLNTVARLETKGRLIPYPDIHLWISPDGRYLIVQTQVTDLPKSWRSYQYPYLQMVLQNPPKGLNLGIEQYILIDLIDGVSTALLDAPIGPTGSELIWGADSSTVVVSDVYLPLDIKDAEERKVRESSTFSVAIEVPRRKISKVGSGDLKLLRWDRQTNTVVFAKGRIGFLGGSSVKTSFFRKEGTSWREVNPSPADVRAERPEIILDENLNKPPTVLAVAPQSHQQALLMDLNPQFQELNFGEVKEINWKATDGHAVNGGLYLPPDYIPGKKYPLIIQTHGFTEKKFWINGPWPTAFAAQPLASKGFIVLQADEGLGHDDTPQEAPTEMSSYEGAIESLDGIGLIDRTHVGLAGFSRTCLHVKYSLTHSKFHFAAAVVADGVDAGYFQDLAFANAEPGISSDFDVLNGASPFGAGLSSWLENSPGFNLDKVSAPVLIQALGRGSLLSEWEWFSGLSRLEKPLDMVYLPDGVHILVKPWEQMTSEQLTVDWFCFWLKREEDPDPAKAEQYARWRELRKLQEQNDRQPQQANPPSVH